VAIPSLAGAVILMFMRRQVPRAQKRQPGAGVS